MKHDEEEPLTLEAFLMKTKELGPKQAGSLETFPQERKAVDSSEVRAQLKELVDQLADLADQGDRAIQRFLLEFSASGAYLLATASEKPGEPCPDCGKIH